ncbi:FAD-dependent monooxygenase [Tolypocladium paradoxum]|uniref:FAD-dependent monooxygenase n=1 Tax=Tolypocladium paradoxum TaxID=94208 RepID=A0A2S4KN99_9HYPO|nr:FAD-dependent monooxygenase [Tolypocladium paradoxum]
MSEDFKVLIIGGSVAGLTLALCLEKLEISFEILEQSEDISPQVGASIGIMPNGALILDQLGIFEAVESVIEPLEFARIRFPDGFFFQSQYPSKIRSHFGYPLSFLERQKFLEILYNKIRHKDRVHTSQKALRIESREGRVVVRTADKEYSGHLVVGADGVHSIVRSEIWKHSKPGTIADSEKSTLRIDYACVYGISSGVPGVEDGLQLSLLDHGLTIHVFNGKNRKVFWFVITKTNKRYSYTDRPHFDTQDAREICESLKSKKLDSALTFGDVWENRDIFTITPLEEGWFKTWHSGRLVCMGDAVRKLTPNLGQGANMAIEDAAALANTLWKGDLRRAMTDTRAMDDIIQHLSTSRLAITRQACRQSEFLTRLQAGDGVAKRLLARYVVPILHDLPAASSTATLRGTQRLEFVGLPARAGQQHAAWPLARNLRGCVPRSHVLFLICIGALITWCASGWVWNYTSMLDTTILSHV